MSVVAVTGCSGYIGSRVLDFLQGSPAVEKVVGVDVQACSCAASKLSFHRRDIRDRGLAALFEQEGVEAVVHLAFILNPLHDEALMYDINVNGARNVMAAAAACGAGHLVIASSSSAFGAWPDNPEWLQERDHPRLMRHFSYAADKFEIEMAARIFREENPGVRTAVVRPCAVYGPGVDNYFSHILERLPVVPDVGGGNAAMQFVHEDDVAATFLAVIERRAEGFFHAAGEGTISVAEVAEMAGKRLLRLPSALVYPAVDLLWRLRFPLVKGPSGMLDFMRYRCTISDGLTRAELGLGPRRSSREVVGLMLAR
jgi:UDP-glucose 4-epimerase